MNEIITIGIGLLLAAFFAGTETAFVANLYRKSTGLIEWWRRRPEKLLATTLVGTNIAIITATSVATEMAIERWGPQSEFYVTIAISVFGLIFCEVIPKSAALRYSVQWTQKTAPLLYLFHLILFPIIVVVNAFSTAVTRIFEKFGEEISPQPVELMEFLRRPLKGFDTGRLLTLLIFLRFAGKKVRDLMLPANVLARIKIGEKGRIAHQLISRGYPYIVCEDEDGHPVGVVDAAMAGMISPDSEVKPADISTQFLPESKDAAEFLRENLRKGNPPALVINEHGEVTGAIGGIPLMEKMLRTKELPATKTLELPGSSVVLPGDTPLERLEIMAGIEIPRGQYQTVAGFIEELVHKIPRQGETIQWSGLKFDILSADQRRIKKVRITKVVENP